MLGTPSKSSVTPHTKWRDDLPEVRSHPSVWARVSMYLDLGTLTAERGDVKSELVKSAITNLEWVQQQLERFDGPMKPLLLSDCHRGLAMAYLRNGEDKKAEMFARGNLERQRKKFPDILLACEQDVNLFAKVVEKQFGDALAKADFDGCQEALSKSTETWRTLFGPEHWRVRDGKARIKVLAKAAKLDKSRRDRFVKAHANAVEFDDRFLMRMTQEAADVALGVMSELKELVGTEYPLYERLRGALVTIYARIGDLPNAEKHSSELVEAARKLQGRASELAGHAFISLADLDEGQRVDPVWHLLPAYFIFQQCNSLNSAVCGMTFHRLGRSYLSKGLWPSADRYLRKSLGVLCRFPIEYRVYYAICLAEHGTACSRMGDRDRAEAELALGHEIATRISDQPSVTRGICAEMRGQHYHRMTEYQPAEKYMREALEQYRQVYGEQSSEYAGALTQVANILRDKGDNLLAEPLYQLAVQSFSRLSGEDSLAVSSVLAFRGRMHMDHGQLDRAQADFERALSVAKKHNTSAVLALSDLGDLAFQQQHRSRAFAFYDQYCDSEQQNAAHLSMNLTESQQLVIGERLHEALGRMLSVESPNSDVELIYSRVLSWKGAAVARQQGLRRIRDLAGLEQRFSAWEKASSRLATLALRVPYPEDRDLWLLQVRDALAERDRMEAELADTAMLPTPTAPTVKDLAASLPEKTALIDLVEYVRRVPDDRTKGKWQMERRWVAFVVRNDRDLQMIDLGDARSGTEEIESWLKTVMLNDDKKQPLLSDIGQRIYKQIWEPLKPAIDGMNLLLIAPDGALARFPLGALVDADDQKFLTEKFGMIMVPVPALLPQSMTDKTTTLSDGPLVAFGEVNYDENSSKSDAHRGTYNSDRGWLSGTFGHLKNTGPEVDTVGLRFANSFPNAPELVFKQKDCTEEQFRRHAPKARWLHLATHGFFAPDLIRSIFEGKSASERQSQKPNPDEARGEFRIHPGLLSGLALAGANFPGRPDEDDGILSSMEVSSCNLSNVELAVLSACETAQGKVANGEGVLGLQRAFQVAGARSVMGTLWSIDDAATRLLMMRFYRNLWEKRMGKLESLREAQVWMIQSARNSILAGESPKTATLDSDKLPPHLLHPSIWAPFVLSGDWN